MKKSVRKLKEEVKQEKSPYVQVIGDFLVDHIDNNPDFGKYVLREGRTIVGSLEYVKSFAQKEQVNGVAVMADDAVFKHVLKYFKLKELPKPKVVERPKIVPTHVTKPKPKASPKEEEYGEASLLNLVEDETEE